MGTKRIRNSGYHHLNMDMTSFNNQGYLNCELGNLQAFIYLEKPAHISDGEL